MMFDTNSFDDDFTLQYSAQLFYYAEFALGHEWKTGGAKIELFPLLSKSRQTGSPPRTACCARIETLFARKIQSF